MFGRKRTLPHPAATGISPRCGSRDSPVLNKHTQNYNLYTETPQLIPKTKFKEMLNGTQ